MNDCPCLLAPDTSPCGHLEGNESACICVDDAWQLPA
jgi:hypothetical protein